ncbi:hypothetical protein L9F63_003711, partial [Diploptera punctata]
MHPLYKPLLAPEDKRASEVIGVRRHTVSRRLWCIMVKQGTVKRCVGALIVLSAISIIFYTNYLISSPFS